LEQEKKKSTLEASQPSSMSSSDLQPGHTLLTVPMEEIYNLPLELREKMFYSFLMRGEELLKMGPEFSDQAVQMFFKATKLLPNPTDLLMAIQSLLPESIFASLTSLITTEVMLK
jgi:MAS20 protein import receptor